MWLVPGSSAGVEAQWCVWMMSCSSGPAPEPCYRSTAGASGPTGTNK